MVRAHPAAAGAQQKNGPQALGYRRGGYGTKIHAAVNGRGHPVAVTVTAGPAGDAPQAAALLAGRRRGEVRVVVADRGYDTDPILARVRQRRARVVIPPTARRTHPRRYSRRLYQGRNVVERYWNRVKLCRRVATRYDKLDTSYLGFVHLASIRTVLRHP